MDFSVVLSVLQNQFSGQLVLYVDDLAQVLGKSEKAISNLIARKNLPFKIKTVGGHRCVDIFQVAQWLASDAEVAQQVATKAARTPKNNAGNPVPVEPQKGKQAAVRPQAKPVSVNGSMSARILEMRHDYGALMSRLSCQGRKSDELLFMHELSELLFYSGAGISSSYVATIKKRSPTGRKNLGEESTRYFAAQEHAIQYLLTKMYSADRSKAVNVQQFELKHHDEVLLQLVKNGPTWILLNNKVEVAEVRGLF